MNRLHEQFGDQIDFSHLDIDRLETGPVREQFNILRRTQYVLTDPQGDVLLSWFGPLDGDALATQIQAELARLALADG